MYSNRIWISNFLLLITCLVAFSLSASAQHVRLVTHQRSFLPPDEARDLFIAGEVSYDQRKFLDAEKRFREVITRFPKNPIADKAEYYLIRTLTQTGKSAEALSRIDGFAKQYPRSNWLNDVQELRMRLTNQVPVNAEYILLQQPAPVSGRGSARGNTPARVQASGTPPTPPSPAAPPSPAVVPSPFGYSFGSGFATFEFQSSDPEISFQQEIMRAMFMNNFQRALEIATERLKTNPGDPVVLSSLNVIATSRSAQAMPMLLDIAKNSTNSKARRDAIYWLGQSRGDRDAIVDTLVALMPSLSDEDAEAVPFALSQIRTDKSLSALTSIARDKNKSEKVRNGAVFGISQSRAANRIGLLDDIYKNSMDNSKIRLQVLFALTQTREPQALTLLGNIASGDPDINVRKQAVFWIGQNRSPEAKDILERLLQKK